MLIYVAGKDRRRAQAAAASLIEAGHRIQCRWWEDAFRYTPAEERDFISDSDALVYLWEGDQESARYEAGMAMALGKPIVVVHRDPQWFLTLPNVVSCSDDVHVVNALTALTAQTADRAAKMAHSSVAHRNSGDQRSMASIAPSRSVDRRR